MIKTSLLLGLFAIGVTAGVAIYFANKGIPVKVGTPFFKAEIN